MTPGRRAREVVVRYQRALMIVSARMTKLFGIRCEGDSFACCCLSVGSRVHGVLPRWRASVTRPARVERLRALSRVPDNVFVLTTGHWTTTGHWARRCWYVLVSAEQPKRALQRHYCCSAAMSVGRYQRTSIGKIINTVLETIEFSYQRGLYIFCFCSLLHDIIK